jgi:hypothetical protein
VDKSKLYVELFSYTKGQWLDVVEFHFQPDKDSGTRVTVSQSKLAN